MPPNVAPPKSTGGGGNRFEVKVGAYFLACMLADIKILNRQIARVDFQVRVDGWFLDDLLLTMQEEGGLYRCAFSIRSNVQFKSGRAPEDFVRLAWEQFLHLNSNSFSEDTDYLGLITATLPVSTREALSSTPSQKC